MINVLIISKYGTVESKQVNHIPRIGEKIGMFYQPYPTVQEIIWWPDSDVIRSLGFDDSENIEVIIAVE